MKVVQFAPKPAEPEQKPDTAEMLKTLDSLRERVLSGEVVGFATVGVSADDQSFAWIAQSGGVTRLRLIGALSWLHHCYCDGSIDDWKDV